MPVSSDYNLSTVGGQYFIWDEATTVAPDYFQRVFGEALRQEDGEWAAIQQREEYLRSERDRLRNEADTITQRQVDRGDCDRPDEQAFHWHPDRLEWVRIPLPVQREGTWALEGEVEEEVNVDIPCQEVG